VGLNDKDEDWRFGDEIIAVAEPSRVYVGGEKVCEGDC